MGAFSTTSSSWNEKKEMFEPEESFHYRTMMLSKLPHSFSDKIAKNYEGL